MAYPYSKRRQPQARVRRFRSREGEEFVVVAPAADDPYANYPGMRPPAITVDAGSGDASSTDDGAPPMDDFVDWKTIVDSPPNCGEGDKACVDPQAFTAAQCHALNTMVETIRVSPSAKVLTRDFQQGARTTARLRKLIEELGNGAPVQGSFNGVDVSVGQNGTGWMVGAHSIQRNFLSLGAMIRVSRTVLGTADAIITIHNDPAVLGADGVSKALPLISATRPDALIRGRGGQSLKIRVTQNSCSIVLLPFYRPSSANFDTAQVDLGRAPPIPSVAGAYAYWASIGAAVGELGYSYIVNSSSALSGVTLEPLANNNLETVKALMGQV